MSALHLHRALHKTPPARCVHHRDCAICAIDRHTNWIERVAVLVLILLALLFIAAGAFP